MSAKRSDHSRTAPRTVVLRVLLLVGIVSLVGCQGVRKPTPLPPNAIRPVVAVISFEDRSGFRGPWEIDRDMTDLLIAEIVWSDRFEVVERRLLGTVVDEIKQQVSDLFREEGRAQYGQLKNARYHIRGTIDEFTQVSGGAWNLALKRVFLAGRGYTARVSLTLTIVDVESGRIVASSKGAGTASAKEAYAEASYDDIAFGGEAFFRTPLGIATRDALRTAVVAATEEMPLDIWRPVVAFVSDENVVVNGGVDHGISKGAIYLVREPAVDITDPITGDIITTQAGDVVGRIQIVAVEDHAAIARPLSGAAFQRGQSLEREE